MAIFCATFAAVSATAAQDVFEIVSGASKRIAIHEISVGQYSDAGDSEAELLSFLVMRGHTSSGSGGSTPTPANISGVASATAATATVEANNTTVASGGSPVTLYATAFNAQVGMRYYPAPENRIILDVSQRLVARITAPADALTINGTLIFEELEEPGFSRGGGYDWARRFR